MKFIASIRLEATTPAPNGFASLDFCRVFGLPDRATTGGMLHGQTAKVEVTEAFARFHFGTTSGWVDEIRSQVDFPWQDLRPGELVEDETATIRTGAGLAKGVALNLSDDRIREIFVSHSKKD